MESRTRTSWRDIIGAKARICRYARMGIVDYKICPNDFRCEICEVDQRMEDLLGTHPALAAPPVDKKKPVHIYEFTLPMWLYYSRGHVWARFMDGVVKLGIDDFSRAVLHRVEEITFPQPEGPIGRGEVIWELKVADKTLPMLSPVPGRIISINPALDVDPALITRDPYERGWIALLVPERQEQLTTARGHLLYSFEARRWMKEEAERLYAWSDPSTGSMATDGGKIIANLPARLGPQQWQALVNDFFARI
jgi:glycine cleavage system H protein